MLNKTILLDDDIPMSLIRKTGETVHNWFSPGTFKKTETPCEFYRKNKIRCYRFRKLRNGSTRLSVISAEGLETFSYGRNFSLAYLKLVSKFYELNQNKNLTT